MATATRVHLSTDDQKPEFYRPGLTPDQAKKATEQLQENHEKHHIFFHPDGLHNHTVHYQLAILALNASANNLQKAFEKNKSYQRQIPPVDNDVLQHLHEPDVFMKHLSVKDDYGTWLKFFQTEMERSSWEDVLQRYVFAGNEQSDAILLRMFAGFLHPIIHLGYGVEFHQPAIIAEALAQAACSDGWVAKFLFPAEQAAKEQPSSTKSIAQLLDEIRADDKLRVAAHWEDGNKIRDGILPRAGDDMVRYAAQVHVGADELERKTAEMTNAVCLYTAAAQHPPSMVMWDFYFMHCVNASIFFPAFNKLPFLTSAHKTRLLEWKIRMDLAMYASRRCPPILLDEIRSYKPKQPSNWDGVVDRVCDFFDDGHAAKLVRALAHGQRICQPYEDREEFRVKAEDWLQMGHMAIDSVENTRRFDVSTWVRSAGFEEAWENIPIRSQL